MKNLQTASSISLVSASTSCRRASTLLMARKFLSNMKKTYLIPAINIEEAQAVQMLAESLAINSDTTVDGGDALTKEDNGWDIWNAE
jgi:hypothetical protein